MTSYLRLNKVSKFFVQGSKQISVLDDVSFCFGSDVSYAITGASGIGKSTLMHILAGTDLPSAGEVLWNGKIVNKFSAKQKELFWNQELGLVFQQSCLIDDLTVLENVALKGLIGGQRVKDSELQAQDILEQVGLGDRVNFFPNFLSKGQQQRVAIARALMGRPKIILADEPTGNLDLDTGRQIVDVLMSLKDKYKIGLIVSTHDQYVYSVMDTVLQIDDSRLVNYS